jgi:hypothetical protein
MTIFLCLGYFEADKAIILGLRQKYISSNFDNGIAVNTL